MHFSLYNSKKYMCPFEIVSDHHHHHHHHHHSNHLVDPNALPGWRLIQRSPEAVAYRKDLADAVLRATKDLRLAARQRRRPGVVSLAPRNQLNDLPASSTQLPPDRSSSGLGLYMDRSNTKESKMSDKVKESNGGKNAYGNEAHSLQLAYQRAPVVAPPPIKSPTNASSTHGQPSYTSPEKSNSRLVAG